MEKFLNSTVTIGDMGIGYPKDDKERNWYETQGFFKKDTLKVCFETKTRIIKSWNNDISVLYPSDGDSIVELDYDIKQLSYENRYFINESFNDIIIDDKFERIKKINWLKVDAENTINALRVKIDEVQYAGLEDTTPSYSEHMRQWVIFRSELNECEGTNDIDIPTPPDEKGV